MSDARDRDARAGSSGRAEAGALAGRATDARRTRERDGDVDRAIGGSRYLGGGSYASEYGRSAPRRDEFLTSAMLCVGAVSVCIVSVMIAGGLAFVGLSENRAEHAMDFVRNAPDAWTSSGAYRGGDVNAAAEGRLFAASGGAAARGSRFDYFAQPDRVDQASLVDELDRRYGERLRAMMLELRANPNGFGGESNALLTSTQTRGADPSYLPPAPMTEAERDMNAAAERLRRLPNERLPSVEEEEEEKEEEPKASRRVDPEDPFDEVDDDDDDSDRVERPRHRSHESDRDEHHGARTKRHKFGVLATEEREYAELTQPRAVVNKARERFEQFENTPEWHQRIRKDCDNYVERLKEIDVLVRKSASNGHASAAKEIKLGVEAVRQWHATISRDLKSKVAVMEVALEKIADAKSKDAEVRVSALSEDIEDELDALTTTMDRADNLKSVLGNLIEVLSREPEADAQPSEQESAADIGASTKAKRGWTGVEKTWAGRDAAGKRDVSIASPSADEVTPENDDGELSLPDDESTQSSKGMKETPVASLAKLAPGGDAPWVHASSRSYAALGSAGDAAWNEPEDVAELGTTLADALAEIVSVIHNVTDSVMQTELSILNRTRFNLTVEVIAEDEPNATETKSTVSVIEAEESSIGADERKRAKAPSRHGPKKLAALGSSWGANEWTGTDATDATWDPIRGDNEGVYVGDAAKKLDWTVPPDGSEYSLAASQPLEGTPTPEDEDFDGKSKQRAVEQFAEAEHKSAEAWRKEAIKAQQKLEELATKGLENNQELDRSAEAVERLKGLVDEFKKALVRESTARAKAEKMLEEERTRSAQEQEDLEKRVVEQAKLQILAARAEARDASLARIKAEQEVEKALKEKTALAKAAAKVQMSADKALKTLMADRDAEVGARETESDEKETEYDEAKTGKSDEDVADVLNAAAEAAERSAKEKKAAHTDEKPKASTSDEKPTTWDSALEDIKAEAAAKEDGAKKSTASEVKKTTATAAKPTKEAKETSEKHTESFESTIVVSAYDVSKKDMKLLRGAALSLLSARAPGACADDTLDIKKSTNLDGSVTLTLKCDGITASAKKQADDAMKWAFQSSRFGANLEKIGFASAAADDLKLQR